MPGAVYLTCRLLEHGFLSVFIVKAMIINFQTGLSFSRRFSKLDWGCFSQYHEIQAILDHTDGRAARIAVG
jgi:hypothetical protein